MITNLEHEAGTMICTAANGDTAKRKTNMPYAAAIVGRECRTGKLKIVTASLSESTLRREFGSIHDAEIGSRLYCRYHGFDKLEFVTPADSWEPCPEDPTGEKADAALFAARRA